MATSSVVNNVVNQMKQLAPKVAKKPKPKEKLNFIAFVLDASSSMDHLKNKVIESYNAVLRTIQEEAKVSKQNTYVSLFCFADSVTTVYENVLNGRELTANDYKVYGNTALHDGVGEAIVSLSKKSKASNSDVSYLVITMTDGQENASQLYKTDKWSYNSKLVLSEIIKAKHGEANWTFAFQGPPSSSRTIATQFGVPIDNVIEWQPTIAGLKEAEKRTSMGTQSYFAARGEGAKSVDNFYLDASKVSVGQVKNNLDDVSDKYHLYECLAEEAIKEFVERKTKKPYVIGAAAYQITKPELLRQDRDILVMENGKKAIWTGPAARKLLNLPTDRNVKIIPKNFSNYLLYTVSRSVNRKLVRGTKVLVDTTKTKADQETWNSQGVKK